MYHDILTQLTDEEIRRLVSTAEPPQSIEEALEQGAVYREFVKRIEEGRYV